MEESVILYPEPNRGLNDATATKDRFFNGSFRCMFWSLIGTSSRPHSEKLLVAQTAFLPWELKLSRRCRGYAYAFGIGRA